MRLNELPPYIAITGPTACGKTAAALALAKNWDIEIVSVDSALVYKEMDIGTAKPKQIERQNVPHHLIDICEPTSPYSAADFAKDASNCMHDIHSRGKMHVLVGGTLLYFKALWGCLDDLPSSNMQIRAEMEQQAQKIGWSKMHAHLAKIDPITAQRLSPNDSQRIGRALEVHRLSGVPMSSLLTNPNHVNPQQPAWGARALLLSLEPHPNSRKGLHHRIEQRFNAMLHEGFAYEVTRLHARGDLSMDTPSMRCVGYRQMWQALDAVHWQVENLQPPKKQTQDWHEQSLAATRQLAKRQLTSLRSLPHRCIVHCDDVNGDPNGAAWVESEIKRHVFGFTSKQH